MLYTIKVHGSIYKDQKLATIYHFRNNSSLGIFFNNNYYTFQEFSKLAGIRKGLLRVALSDEVVPDRSTDTHDHKSKINKLNNMDNFTFLKFAASVIHPYSGNTDGLESFINNVNLVGGLGDATVHANFFLFVKGRLTGKAATVCSGCNSINQIIACLRENICRDPSEVLESRLNALTFDNKNLTDFCVEVEKIADSLLDSLISEGVSRPKANSMTIDKVIRVCRKSSHNDTVKAVLAASSYTTPKDVLSKFRTEISECTQDRQFLALQQQRNYHENNRRSKNNWSSFNYHPNNNNNWNNNNYWNSGHNNSNNRQSNNNRPRSNNNHPSNNYNSHPSNRNIRAFQESENSEPSGRWPTDQTQQQE